MPKINFETIDLILSDVPEHKKFTCADLSIFLNLKELATSISLMDEKTFKHHVNSEKNDFANWIYDVIGDIKLSENLRKTKDPKVAAKKIETRITYIEKHIKNIS